MASPRDAAPIAHRYESVNAACLNLLEVLGTFDDLTRFRHVVETQIEIRRRFVDSDNPDHAHVVEAFRAWRAFADLIDTISRATPRQEAP